MVQVDIFWGYGIGAGLALAAHRQIATLVKKTESAWTAAMNSSYFTKTLLFLSLVFVPSGFWLLWAFPSWETMQAGDRNLPVWLVGAFSVTNMTQGILGYIVAQQLIRKNKVYGAWLTLIAAYFGFFFILVHGWDGEGYMRFFSPTLADYNPSWSWNTALSWFSSDVALTLYGMSVIFLPSLCGLTVAWIRDGEGGRRSVLQILTGFLGSVLVLSLGTAILCSIAYISLGFVLGSLASLLLILLAVHPRIGIGPLFFRWMTGVTPSLRSRLSAAAAFSRS